MNIFKKLKTVLPISAACIVTAIKAAGQPQPVNPNATPETRSVLEFLYKVRESNQMLSAQHIYIKHGEAYNEAEHVRKLTGKYPAIIEFDLLGFHKSPRSKERFLSFAKQWHESGGLVAVSWHETSPALAVPDEGGYRQGTQKKMTQEDFSLVLTEGTELHARWVEHVDLAAQWLGELQDAGVVVLWRPYHEMTGGWFWWGDKEAKSFRRLWRELYERLTVEHGLNNLIWVWSAAQAGQDFESFFPYDYVDIGGVDLYRSNRSDEAFVQFAARAQQAAKDKPVALTEVGAMPTLDILLNQTGFIWFNIWGNGWLDNEHYPRPEQNGPGNSPEWIREIYAHPKVITREEIELR